MLGELLAVLGAFLSSSGILFVRVGLEDSTYFTAALIVSLIGFMIFGVVALITVSLPLSSISIYATIFFFLAGIFSPAIVRLVYYKGIEKLGTPVNASVFASYPLFSMLFAILLLEEIVSVGTYVGGVMIVSGVIFLQQSLKEGKTERKTKLFDFTYPTVASISAALAIVFRKMGLNILDDPIFGLSISYLASLILISSLTSFPKMRRGIIINAEALKSFLKAGLCLAAGWFAFFYALRYGDAASVASLINTETLFITLLSYIFLKRLEKVTASLFLSAAIVTLGAFIILLL